MGDNTPLYFKLVYTDVKVHFDYTPEWGRNTSRHESFIDNVRFPKVLTNKQYWYRVVSNGGHNGGTIDLIREPYEVEANGSHKVNFMDYNAGYGFAAWSKIQVFAVDPLNLNQYQVAQWN